MGLIIIFAAFVLLSVSGVEAQDDPLTETYVSRDRSFTFDYPPGWQVKEDQYYVTLTGATRFGPVAMLAFRPWLVMLLAGRSRDPVEILNKLRDTFDFIVSDASAANISGRPGAVASADLKNGFAGFAFITQMSDGRYGMVVALTSKETLQPFIPLIELMVRRYDTPGDEPLPIRDVVLLDNPGAPWETVIRELKDKSMIGRDGRLLFNTAALDFEGAGNWLNNPGADSPATDVVMAGQLAFTFENASGYESCSMMARLVKDEAGSVQQYLEVGIDNQGEIFYYNVYGATAKDVFSETVMQKVESGQAINFLMITGGGRMTLYLNGQRALDNVRVAATEGVYALVMRANSVKSGCQFRNVWVFETAGLRYGICRVRADGQITTRLGPGLGYTAHSDMYHNTTKYAVSFTHDRYEPELRWWKLDNGAWVREDVVIEEGDCDTLPEEVELSP